jgi:hypothetical protein
MPISAAGHRNRSLTVPICGILAGFSETGAALEREPEYTIPPSTPRAALKPERLAVSILE